RQGNPAVARVPALARLALLVGRELRAMQIADEPGARPARSIRAPLDAAAHVEAAPGPRRLGRQAHDPLSGNGRGQLPLAGEALVALQDALLGGGRQLPGVVAAEPAVARARARLAAAGHRAEAARPAAVSFHPSARDARDRLPDLLLHQFGNRGAQVLR